MKPFFRRDFIRFLLDHEAVSHENGLVFELNRLHTGRQMVKVGCFYADFIHSLPCKIDVVCGELLHFVPLCVATSMMLSDEFSFDVSWSCASESMGESVHHQSVVVVCDNLRSLNNMISNGSLMDIFYQGGTVVAIVIGTGLTKHDILTLEGYNINVYAMLTPQDLD